jgi:protein ImuB
VKRSWRERRERLVGDAPLVVTGKRGNAEQLVAVDETAERLGLRVGLALAQARAMHPALIAVAEEPDADARLLATLADWCQRYTPLVALDAPDGLLLDIGGCAHLFGGEAALLDDIARRVTRFGFAAEAAIADTVGAAFAAARFSPGLCVEAGGERAALAPLPPAALRLPQETVALLARLGLKRIGDIVDLPRKPLAARFGIEFLRQLDRALGRDREPLNPLRPVAPYVAEQRFAEPIAREEDVLAVTVRLAARLRALLEKRGEGARRIELSLFRTDGAVKRVEAGASRPLRDPQEIRALFAERLAALGDEFDPGFGFDLMRLSVTAAEPAPEEQSGFGASEDAAQVDRLIDRLAARLGSRRVGRLVAHDSHIPECAAGVLPAQAQRSAEIDDGWRAFRRHRARVALAPRPLRLFARPEPIEAIAMVPDGPPLRFRWRRALHEVAAAEGPERIEGAWWSEEGGPARDYFRIEDIAGHRFWLFRAGLYREIVQPRWFLHGLFG